VRQLSHEVATLPPGGVLLPLQSLEVLTHGCQSHTQCALRQLLAERRAWAITIV
jgi:hypothetical protein